MKAIIANRIAQKAIIMGASRGSLVEVMALKVQSDLHHTGLRNRGMHTLCQNIIKHPSQMQIGSSSSGRSAIACRIVGRKAGGHLEQTGQLSSLGSIIGAAYKEGPLLQKLSMR